MKPRLGELLTEWSLRDWAPGDEIFLDHDAIQYLGRKIYDDYEPAQFDLFDDRLDRWLHNVELDLDRQNLFRLLGHLFFVGRPEFESLCRAAHNGPVLRWLIELLDIDISDVQATERLIDGLSATWFCPITDSMRINSYLKVNSLEGRSHQPDWRSLRKFADPEKIVAFLTANKIERIVLLEDFVGSGTQMKTAVKFAAAIEANVNILVCPLVVCPAGIAVGEALRDAFKNVSFEPVLKIPEATLVKAEVQPGEPPLFSAIRELTTRIHDRLATPGPDEETFHGFKGTGAVFAMYSNCPNNTLPILRDNTSEWAPLFPRIRRT
jgi:hypothetical protein